MVKLKKIDFSNARLHFAFEGLIALIPYLILPFSAPIAFFAALFLLLVLSFFSPGRFARVALGICIAIGGAVSYSDCDLCQGDLINYYTTYTNLAHGNLDSIFDYGKGVEFLLPLYWFFWTLIFGQISSVHFDILNVFTQSILLLIWIEKYSAERLSKQEIAVCIVLVFLLYEFLGGGWLIRQYYSSIFLLFALTAYSRFKIFFFLLLAFLCHTSAILFFVIFYILQKYPKSGFIVMGFLAFMFVSQSIFPVIFNYVDILPDFFKLKLGVYTKVMQDGALPSPRYLIIGFILVLYSLIFFKKIDSQWRWIIILYGPICCIAGFISIHFFERLVVLYYAVASGFFFFVVLKNSYVMLYLWAFILFIDRIRTYIKFKDNPIGSFVNFYPITGDWFYFLLQ
ncbi:hypothetical protein CQA49_07940 [Helicobacter sp. MIT 00-7814]|uniref:EpsG family protein n=1 Tax=unclassified Helicobacter TaxID=2593540 RepID=UPI000E1F62B8|nr:MULTISPECIES: EpsG family protein [unclassified Helicobacter]RDU52619.1 hypothetical protein CQA49_07940 [Helicobacter sp. MIT 00-7814]RDU55924.1 hypothetical protein CQA37_03250 [Helicobacter sp. MIT 99-10781]